MSTSSPTRSAAKDPTGHTPDADNTTARTAWRWVSFLIGCALLVACAWALAYRLQQWSHDYGAVLVFLVFFLIMSIAGRWFWAGIDAGLGRVIQGRKR